MKDKEKKEVEKIRSCYIPKTEKKIDEVKQLDKKIRRPAKIISSIVFVSGLLLMGYGMSLVMVNSILTHGILISSFGLIIAILSYPVYMLFAKKVKLKYAKKAISLTEEMLKNA